MAQADELARRFEEHRGRLRAVADRMLGTHGEAEDAVQETWLRLTRVDADGIDNLGGWLTTVVSRVCLDVLRARRSRREEPDRPSEALPDAADGPEQEAVLVDAVGRALLVVLDRLTPDERVAFVLHDLFAVPFGQIAPVVDRSPDTAKKLASRARGKVRAAPTAPGGVTGQRRLVEAFLAASRTGDLAALLDLLAPDVIRRADPAAIPADRPAVLRGVTAVSGEIAAFGRNARFAVPVLVDGVVGAAVAPGGRLRLVITLDTDGERITGYTIVADPARLAALAIAVLP